METFGAVIVGSGYGGSIVAARLATAGVSTLVLDSLCWSTYGS